MLRDALHDQHATLSHDQSDSHEVEDEENDNKKKDQHNRKQGIGGVIQRWGRV